MSDLLSKSDKHKNILFARHVLPRILRCTCFFFLLVVGILHVVVDAAGNAHLNPICLVVVTDARSWNPCFVSRVLNCIVL